MAGQTAKKERIMKTSWNLGGQIAVCAGLSQPPSTVSGWPVGETDPLHRKGQPLRGSGAEGTTHPAAAPW